jgi:hypothetical protein
MPVSQFANLFSETQKCFSFVVNRWRKRRFLSHLFGGGTFDELWSLGWWKNEVLMQFSLTKVIVS